MKKTVMGVAAVALITVALPQTSHAWGFLNGNTTYVTPQSAGGDQRQNAHNITNSKNIGGNLSNDSSNHSSASASSGGGWGWGWWGGWGGGGANASSVAGQVSGGQGSNFGNMGNGGNVMTQNLGDVISTGTTYNGDRYLSDREETTRQGIYSNREIELARIRR